MLNAYLTALQNLVQAPTAPTPLISNATATSYINTARNQLAADAECIRVDAALTLIPGTWGYAFGAITVPLNAGYGSVISVRSAVHGGNNMEVRPWEWYAAYYLGHTTVGNPTLVSQQGQGVSGTLFFWPRPNASVNPLAVNLDAVCLPQALVDDNSVEAIPVMFRDAVPFYTAFLAMQQLQRQSDAQAMLQRYMLLARRGRQFATPSELPDNMPGGAGTQMAAARTTLGEPATSGGR